MWVGDLHRIFFCVLSGLALVACETGTIPAPKGSVRVAPEVVLALPKPSDLGRTLEASQLVTAHYGGQTFTFEGYISVTPERLLLLGLDMMGRLALSVTWTEAGIQSETAPWLPEQVRPENMLADIVMLYWPEDSVRGALSGAGNALASGPRYRSILSGGKEMIHADYDSDDPWTGTLNYRNLAWGYGLTVRSAEIPR